MGDSDAGRPPVFPAPLTAAVAHIVERWAAPHSGTTRNIHVYSSAPYVSLLLNGAQIPGVAVQRVDNFTWAQFNNVAYAAGNLTAVALAADGVTVLATASRQSFGAPAALRLSIDVPSPLTGTGNALYLDGGDVALLRAEVLDANGALVLDDAVSINVTFTVTSGPGLILGCGNGDPANQQPNHAVS